MLITVTYLSKVSDLHQSLQQALCEGTKRAAVLRRLVLGLRLLQQGVYVCTKQYRVKKNSEENNH